VRKAATEKKPASAQYRETFMVSEKPVVKSIEAVSSTVDISKQNINANCLYDEYDIVRLSAEYVYDAKKKRYTGVRFTNELLDAYEIYIAQPGEVPSPASSGYLTVKAMGESQLNPAKTTISASKLKGGCVVYIRQKGKASEKRLSSSYVVFGVVDYPEEAPED
jgi:hypothetical protein